MDIKVYFLVLILSVLCNHVRGDDFLADSCLSCYASSYLYCCPDGLIPGIVSCTNQPSRKNCHKTSEKDDPNPPQEILTPPSLDLNKILFEATSRSTPPHWKDWWNRETTTTARHGYYGWKYPTTTPRPWWWKPRTTTSPPWLQNWPTVTVPPWNKDWDKDLQKDLKDLDDNTGSSNYGSENYNSYDTHSSSDHVYVHVGVPVGVVILSVVIALVLTALRCYYRQYRLRRCLQTTHTPGAVQSRRSRLTLVVTRTHRRGPSDTQELVPADETAENFENPEAAGTFPPPPAYSEVVQQGISNDPGAMPEYPAPGAITENPPPYTEHLQPYPGRPHLVSQPIRF